MAQARPGLARAVNEILERCGSEGKRLSLRQVERITGLSPATAGELAKGNARTAGTVRRFAEGLGQDPEPLLALAGFVPDPAATQPMQRPQPDGRPEADQVIRRLSAALDALSGRAERSTVLEAASALARLAEELAKRA